jgi:nicotinate-nucleotide pyrophosphorylase (carboxylating)
VFASDVSVHTQAADAQSIGPGARLAHLEGRVRDILAIERTLLNFLGRLSGIASLTRQYVNAVAATAARIYDTRKTTPGWRLLEKYAVRCGGGYNHRSGLSAAILVKDNHIAARAAGSETSQHTTLAELTHSAREYAETLAARTQTQPLIVEVEVDSLAQLEDVLAGRPNLVLLDNMDTATLRQAVSIRNKLGPGVELEASGGVTLQTIGQIAATGVERISVGALTHQAGWLDIGLDWLE